MPTDGNVLAVARDRIELAEHMLRKRRPTLERRGRYVRGEQGLPFAPQGVNAEYIALQQQAIANWTNLYVSAPVQRLAVEGIRTGIGEDDDERHRVNSEVWGWFQANRWAKRQSRVFRSIMKHNIGVVSVWPSDRDGAAPVMRPEQLENVYLHHDPEDPFVVDWAVKRITAELRPANGLILPDGLAESREIALVYDDVRVLRFERESSSTYGGDWRLVHDTANPLGRPPFATFDFDEYESVDGNSWSGLDHMIIQQDALNTIRFNTLLAMQFSAFRQRIISGFDPRVIDEHGQIVYQTNADGTPRLDDQGQPVPVFVELGKVGVDRLLTFPGVETKVYDLPESNLANYTAVYDSFLAAFFATGQIPTQYMPQRLSNLTGDALAGAESAFASLIREIQRAADEGVTEVAELAWIAAGKDPGDWNPAAEAAWADAEARSFSQIVDSITKLIAVGLPVRAGFEMVPGATDQKVERWMELRDSESFEKMLGQMERPFTDVTALGVTEV